MVEFSLFYFLPPPPLFMYELPEDSSYVAGGFRFAQIDNLQTYITPEGLPDSYAFPVAFKISNGMRASMSVRWAGDWSFYVALPTLHLSTPPLGTSALQGNPPTLLWADIDATVSDTLLPVEVDGLNSKLPVRWRIAGKVSILPILDSKSDFSYMPITFGVGRRLGDYSISVEGNVSRFSGEGFWSIRYVGDRIYEDTFALEGVENQAALAFQFAEDNVGYYHYAFKMDPAILYNLGVKLGRRLGDFNLGVGVEMYNSLTLNFSDSLTYDYIRDLVGDWQRSEFFNNELYAEYSSDSDTVYLKGSAVVGFKTEDVLRDSATLSGTEAYGIRGGMYPFLILSWERGTLFSNLKVSGEGVGAFVRGGEEYGGFFGLDVRFVEQRLSNWRLGAFYASESFIFSFEISRAFGSLRYPYVEFNVPVLSSEIYAYSFGISFVWKLAP
ncbi:MAG: hypothetical protein GXO29_04005 [Thermotogae bacterium]|nr:hypothetical protein [Thermotogota bacterium]